MICRSITFAFIACSYPIFIASSGVKFGNRESPNGFDYRIIQSDLFPNHILPYMNSASLSQFLVTRKSHAVYTNKENIFSSINTLLEQSNEHSILADTQALRELFSAYVRFRELPSQKLISKIKIHELPI